MPTPSSPLPVVILAGSDRRPADLPEPARSFHPLSGYKGMEVRIGGRPLAARVAERLRESGAFSDVFLAGPARVFGPLGGEVEIVDTNGTFGGNIRTSIEAVASRHPGTSIAFTTCDVLPDPNGLRTLVARWRSEGPCDLWFPIVRVPEDHGVLRDSAWKPAYRVPTERGGPAFEVLPGHFAVADPAALNLRFVYRLLDEGYRTRNHPVMHRRAVMAKALLGQLLKGDLAELRAGRPPVVTWTALHAGLTTARELARGRASLAELETAMRRIFVLPAHRRRHPERRVRLPLVDDLWLALDIDTREEAASQGGEVA